MIPCGNLNLNSAITVSHRKIAGNILFYKQETTMGQRQKKKKLMIALSTWTRPLLHIIHNWKLLSCYGHVRHCWDGSTERNRLAARWTKEKCSGCFFSRRNKLAREMGSSHDSNLCNGGYFQGGTDEPTKRSTCQSFMESLGRPGLALDLMRLQQEWAGAKLL